MKATKILLGATLIGSLLSASLFGTVEDYRKLYQATRTDIALPSKVIAPTDLPRRFVDATVMIALTVDAAGLPHDIAIMKPIDPELSRALIPALAQWRFTPAQKDGQPVAQRVVLPIKLAASSY